MMGFIMYTSVGDFSGLYHPAESSRWRYFVNRPKWQEMGMVTYVIF
jgi:hypothetical protein